jgi:hypothetical protein
LMRKAAWLMPAVLAVFAQPSQAQTPAAPPPARDDDNVRS